MTKEELDWLCRLRSEIYVYMPKEWLIPMNNALDMAISALSENKGEWIESKERSKHWYCSVCGGIHTDPETGKWRETFDYRYPFCPNCGADMRGETDGKKA